MSAISEPPEDGAANEVAGLRSRLAKLEHELAEMNAKAAEAEQKRRWVKDAHHVSGSAQHRISNQSWTSFWLTHSGRSSIPRWCPCSTDIDGIRHKQHEINGNLAGAHVEFRNADGQMVIAVVPTSRVKCGSHQYWKYGAAVPRLVAAARACSAAEDHRPLTASHQ